MRALRVASRCDASVSVTLPSWSNDKTYAQSRRHLECLTLVRSAGGLAFHHCSSWSVLMVGASDTCHLDAKGDVRIPNGKFRWLFVFPFFPDVVSSSLSPCGVQYM